jgi:hypothetical protein
VDDQRARVVAAIVQQPASPDAGDGVAGFLQRLCAAVVPALGASGAGLSVMADNEVRGMTTASDPAAASGCSTFRTRPGPLPADEPRQALPFAEVAVTTLLDGQAHAGPGTAAGGLRRWTAAPNCSRPEA